MVDINVAASTQDRTTIAAWLDVLEKHVNGVDLVAARKMFHEAVVGFGSISTVIGQDKLEATQWRLVWPTMEDFRFQIQGLEARLSDDRKFAMAAVTFMSKGVAEDGRTYDRPGRATFVLQRPSLDAEWLAIHNHFSLNPGISHKSFGKKPIIE